MDDVRLVDANSILKKLKSELDGIQRETNYPIGISDGLSFAMATIDTAPTIETQPVKRGRWELCIERFMTSIYACSVCRSKFCIPSNLVPESFYCYCPRCGADMRGEPDVLH